MKKIITCLALAAITGVASAQTVTNLAPNGDFSLGGPTSDWVEVFGGGSFVYTYPSTGGNPANYGVMDNTGGGGWAIWVGGDATPIPLSTLGLTAGVTYNFLVDMKVLSSDPNTNLGGFKVDFFNGVAGAGSTGDMRPSPAGHNVFNWETYSYSVTIPPTANGVKLVPLWGPNSSVGFDNIRVVVPAAIPLAASITSPGNGSTVSTNFTINAAANVSPGSVTNVYFYDGATLLGNDTTSPYSYNVTGASLGAHALKVVAKADTGAWVTSSVVNITVVADPYLYTVDPSKTWVGYMNVFETPGNGGAFVFGSGWGTPDLRASFSGSTLTLSPNTIGDPNIFWYASTGNNSVANKSMDASMYVEVGSLPGVTATFTGSVLNNTLTDNGAFTGPLNPIGNGWTCVAFIKDFAADYSSYNSTTTVLTNGSTFRISLATVNDPARHVQYGFETIGPCVWATDTALAGYGNVQVGPAVSTPNAPTIAASKSGGNISMSFSTQTGFIYTVQYRTNLTTGSWSTLTTTNGTGATAVVTDSAGNAQRYYRVSVQ